ncbi:MAG: RNase LS family HEPN domain-containing protein [Eubacteriales bacterium]
MEGAKIDRNENDNETIFHAKRGKDRLTVKSFLASGKTIIQGSPRNLFNAFVSYITQLLDIDDITPVLNTCYKVEVEKDKVEEQYLIYLPNVSDTISLILKKSLLQSIYNLNYTGDMFDFSYLLHPVLRALEGHFKIILLSMGILLEKDRISCFYPINGTFTFEDTYSNSISDNNMVGYINNTYNFYHANRHSLFHWDTPLGEVDTTRTIENKQDAAILIREALSIINKYYVLCN